MIEQQITIRRAQPGLAPELHALLLACGREMAQRGYGNWDPPPASVERIRAEATEHAVLAALAPDGAVAGSVTVRRTPTHDYAADERAGGVPPADGATAYMNRLAVHPDWQRRGLGERLLDAAAEHARTQGAVALRFDVLASNPELVRWYEQRRCERRGARSHSGLDFVVMERRLEQ